jgi:signal transduction histidine kinase
MFNKVKTKLTIVYTLSLVCLLVLFIGLLYVLISHEINTKEVEELRDYFSKEKHEFMEELYENDEHGLEYEPNRTVFYYVFNSSGELVNGEETKASLNQWIDKNINLSDQELIERLEWRNEHFLVMNFPLDNQGFVILGMDITAEKHLIQRITIILVVLTVFFGGIFALLGYFFAGQAIKPIKLAFDKQEKFVSDASHELRTPLSIFYSSVDLLMREEKDRLSPFGKEVLEDVKTEAHLMNKLIEDLLLLARSDKNFLNLDLKEVNLSQLFKSICSRFLRLQQARVHLIENIQPGVTFTCDETRIQQLVYILLDNAFRYTTEGEVKFILAEESEQIKIIIEDTGCGISPEKLPFIFDRFYRGDETREKGGAGLGLAIAQSIVNAHGGKISATSTLGKGTVFTVIFTEKQEPAA